MAPSSEVLHELWRRLRPMAKNWSPSTQEDVLDTIKDWFHDHFETVNISAGISEAEAITAKERLPEIKAHVARRAAIELAVSICAKHAFGSEKVTPAYYNRQTGLSADYRPAFTPHHLLPVISLDMAMVVMKRHPAGWMRSESAEAWMKRLSGT